MHLFFELFLLGCATGGIYALSAMGLVLVFRSSGVINFAQGTIAMVAGYLCYTFTTTLGWPYSAAIAAAIAVASLTGFLIFLLVIRPLGNASTLTKVIATLGVFELLQQVILLTYGTAPLVPDNFLPTRPISLRGVAMGLDQFILLLFAVAMTVLLWWVFKYTRFGMATSAVAENPRSLAALGWRVDRLRAVNWTLGGALAGLAGVALAPWLQLDPSVFALLIIPMLASAMLGGLRSFPLTLLGGLILGVLQAECPHYITFTGVGDAVPFVVIILILVFMGRSLPLRSHVHERLPRVGSGQIRPVLLIVAAVAVALLIQFILSPDLIAGVTISILAAAVLLSQVVVTGYAGQLSLAQVPIAGMGALVAGRIAAVFHVPFPLAILIGAAAGMACSFAVGLPSLRSRGVSLAIATLGFGVAINSMFLQNESVNGGVTGTYVGYQTFFGYNLNAITNPQNYALFSLAFLVLLGLMVANVRRGRVGRRMLAVRNNERAAASLGVNVPVVKLYAFTVAGAIAGVGGVLSAFSNPSLTFTGYDPLTSILALVQSVIGGIGYVAGAVIGGLLQDGGLLTSVTNIWLANFASYLALILAAGLIIQVLANPNGVADFIARRKPGRLAQAAVARLPWQARLGPEGRRRREAETEIDDAGRTAHDFTGGRLEATDVTVRFGPVTAVDGVSLTVSPGEIVSVIGPNGAGKTSLMDAIAGFAGATGTVTLDEHRLDRLSAHQRARRGLARSFQSLELLEDMTVLDNLKCASDPRDGWSYLIDLVRPKRRTLTAATVAAIDTFKLRPYLHQLPTELPYGVRHLVAIARAVAAAPRVLMLDEPAAGLSEIERAEVGDLILRMARDWKIAVLLIEHDVELVCRVSDRVIVLDFGKQIAVGSPQTVVADPCVVEAYLGHGGPAGPAPVEEAVS